jgi:hypothetical protein
LVRTPAPGFSCHGLPRSATLRLSPESARREYKPRNNEEAVSRVLPHPKQSGHSAGAANRLTTQTWFNSAGTAVETMTYSFDPNGNQLTAGNSAGTYTMTYDALNRVTVRPAHCGGVRGRDTDLSYCPSWVTMKAAG